MHLTPNGDPHEIQVWFERRTKLSMSGGFLEWDPQGTAFDESTMLRQAKLDGGFLFGEMQMPDVSDAELQALFGYLKAVGDQYGQDCPEDPSYIGLAKRLIFVLQPRIATFVSTLRSQYGQYWLQVPSRWDSRRETLGSYCNSILGLRWWYDERQAWFWFLPTKSGAHLTIGPLPGRGYAEYITETDWRRLQRDRCSNDVSTEQQLLGNATRALDSLDYRQAFVEVVSALEIAIGKRLSSQNKVVRSAVQSFLDRETRKAHVAVILLSMGTSDKEIEIALKAIQIRNDVVHDGYEPSDSEAAILRFVIQIVRMIAGIEELKTPALDVSRNSLSAP